MKQPFTTFLLAWLVSTPALADMFDLPNSGYQPTPQQQQLQKQSEEYRRGSEHCHALTIALTDEVAMWNQQVRDNSYDYRPGVGWVSYDSRTVWFQDGQWEMARFHEEMRSASYGKAHLCGSIHARYRGYMACYFQNTMNNEWQRNRNACGSDLYEGYAKDENPSRKEWGRHMDSVQ